MKSPIRDGKVTHAGAEVHLLVGRDVIRTYPLDLWDCPEAMEAYGEVELFIRRKLAL